MIIDAHHHLWDPEVREYGWLAGDVLAPIRRPYRPEDLRAKTKESGVDGTVLVQTVSTVEETEDFLRLADANRDLILGVVGWVDLADPDIASTLGSLRAGPGGDRLVGIRHQAQDEADPKWLARADVLRGLAAIADADLAYDLLVLPHQLDAVITAITEVPQGRYILDHAAKPPIAIGEREPWTSRIHELAAHQNLACKLSGLVTEANWTQWTVEDIRPYAETVLTEFGPERVLFGTDWPVCELASSYAGVTDLARELCADLSDADRAAVFGDNAREWYRLA
jgi:L-fuconolactonase